MITASQAVEYANFLRVQKTQIADIWKIIFEAIAHGRKWGLIEYRKFSGGFVMKETMLYFEELKYKFLTHNESYLRIEFCENAVSL